MDQRCLEVISLKNTNKIKKLKWICFSNIPNNISDSKVLIGENHKSSIPSKSRKALIIEFNMTSVFHFLCLHLTNDNHQIKGFESRLIEYATPLCNCYLTISSIIPKASSFSISSLNKLII
ncbi:hypothetical protein BpHYR1_053616 [Brachionus plicatilis]|uniref:Uncharacterized protein n=1 Tax=Brachionus plicatilis TaxID=10195 RepID=A0A3M7PH40_BRAPC|nr:hypothetical protein BpHYR1_053616 [Brachionus plicatilis]